MTREEVEALEPPPNTSWVGEWHPSFEWDTTMEDDAEGDPVWIRDYLLHDGHEVCCHHTRMMILDRTVDEGEAPVV